MVVHSEDIAGVQSSFSRDIVDSTSTCHFELISSVCVVEHHNEALLSG